MKAVIVRYFGNEEVLELEEDAKIPPLSSGKILIRVVYAGVNPSDTFIREGRYSELLELPYTPGSDASGYIEALGPDLPIESSKLSVGDRVFVAGAKSGSYAECIVVDSIYVFRLHQRLSLSQGAALGIPYFTAYKSLVMGAQMRPGERILVHGASGAVGTAAVQIGRAQGAIVFGTAGTKDGMGVVTDCGAHRVFNHHDPAYKEKMMKELGEGEGFDVIIEHLANANLGNDLQMIKKGSRIIIVGCRGSVEVNPRLLMIYESVIKGINLSKTNMQEWQEIGAAIVAGIEAGWVKPVINKVYSMEEVQSAHYDIMNLKGARGKLIINVSDNFEIPQNVYV